MLAEDLINAAWIPQREILIRPRSHQLADLIGEGFFLPFLGLLGLGRLRLIPPFLGVVFACARVEAGEKAGPFIIFGVAELLGN